jgi:hypothetical protein
MRESGYMKSRANTAEYMMEGQPFDIIVFKKHIEIRG